MTCPDHTFSPRHLVIFAICLPIFLLLSSCRLPDIEKDIRIAIDLNIFKTFVSFRFADAETGELIGKTDGATVKLTFGGRDAAAVVTQTGERPDEFPSVLGMISVALDPYDPFKLEAGKSVAFSFTASAAGYAPTKAALTLSKTGTQICIVCMRKNGYSDDRPQQYLVHPGEVTNGYLPAGFRMITPANLFELDFPDSVQFAGAGGEQTSGQLTLQATRCNRLSETATGGNRVMNFSDQGVISPGILEPESILNLTIKSAGTASLPALPGKPVSWRFPVNDNYPPGDSIPVWSFDPIQNIWQSECYARIILEDTIRFAIAPLFRSCLYASGKVSPTHRVTGEISFTFDRPFLSPNFPGVIIIADAATGQRIQTVPATLFSGLTLPLTLDLPTGSSAILTVSAASSDYEFASLPSSISLLPDQSGFTGSFTLIPLRCRLSGTVKASFPEDFTGYPMPGLLQVQDATSGNTLLSKSISIANSGFSDEFSLMVRENLPVNIRIVPSTLTGDFISSPSQIREESPCMENGSWTFDLKPNTCQLQTTATLTIRGTVPREPVPAEILLLRASDRRLIKRMAVNLAQTATAFNVASFIPENTPVLLVLQPAFSNRPFTSEPAEIRWEDPCNTSLNPEFMITPGYAQLTGKILFTFDPGMAAGEVPVRILTYTRQSDRMVASQDYMVGRADPVILINQFTPAEPLVMKISRAVSNARFSPVPFKIDIPDPSDTPESWSVALYPTQLVPVHFFVKVVCPKGEVLPTVQGYYRIPGEDWHEMNITSGSLTITIELGLTYEVGMILSGVMIDSVFKVDKRENDLTFPLEPADCDKMGWGAPSGR